MNISDNILKYDEKVMFALRSLYSSYGYSQYKMNKFEEYELYVRNKEFLISDNIISFTDTSGKLMALKPDVTLSIIKNGRDIPNYLQKVYYNENVYRVSERTHSFKEIMQIGLECIGEIDDYCICETLLLAAESLKCITDNCVLEVSHLGIVFGILDSLDLTSETRSKIFKLISEKNLHELTEICAGSGIDDKTANVLKKLVTTYGRPESVIPELETIFEKIDDKSSLEQLKRIVSFFKDSRCGDIIRIDFSVVSDINYYNGIVFKGFVEGVPTSILSGGQYDRLMRKMNRKSGAIGFAVYLDMLERLFATGNEFDVDTVLIYDQSCTASELNKCIKPIIESGRSVMALHSIPSKLKYKHIAKIINGEVEFLENNA